MKDVAPFHDGDNPSFLPCGHDRCAVPVYRPSYLPIYNPSGLQPPQQISTHSQSLVTAYSRSPLLRQLSDSHSLSGIPNRLQHYRRPCKSFQGTMGADQGRQDTPCVMLPPLPSMPTLVLPLV